MGQTIQQRQAKVWAKIEAIQADQQVAQDIRQLIADGELESFSKFVNANPHLKVKEAFVMFEALKDIPF